MARPKNDPAGPADLIFISGLIVGICGTLLVAGLFFLVRACVA